MKLNNISSVVSAFEENMLDDELVIYVKEYHKIVVLNQTAGFIWKFILACYENDLSINTDDIVSYILKEYKDSIPIKEELNNDVNETIHLLSESSLIMGKFIGED